MSDSKHFFSKSSDLEENPVSFVNNNLEQTDNHRTAPLNKKTNILEQAENNVFEFIQKPENVLTFDSGIQLNDITIANNLFPAFIPEKASKSSIQKGKSNNRPSDLIGPEIGPDPRNSQCKVQFEQIPTQIGPEGIRFDFAFGYRVVIPPDADCTYDVRFSDIDSGMPLERYTLKGGDTLVGNRKFFIRYRMDIYRNGKHIFVHNYDCIGKRVYVCIPDGGLGDNLAWLPIVDKFRQVSKADVCCVMGEWMIRLVADLYPGLSFIPAGNNPRLSNSYANYFCGIFKSDGKDWRPTDHQFLGMQGAVEAILGLPQEHLKCRLHRGSARPFPEPFVCISTMATNPGKYWNYPDGWNQIIRFLKSYGYRVLDIDRDPQLYFANKRYIIPTEAEDFTGRFPIQQRIDLLEHADFFIGLPSGLSWLAWNLDVPVVMLSGFTMPNCEFPTPYRVQNNLFCHACWNDTDCFFDPNVPVWCPKHAGTPREIECTRAITPKMVRNTILKIPAFQNRIAQIMTIHDRESV